jgi:hypothetical protein
LTVAFGVAVVFGGLVVGGTTAEGATKAVIVSRTARLGSSSLEKGKYSILFDESQDGEVAMLLNGKEVARAKYKLVQLGAEAANTAVILSAGADGSLTVRRFEFKGSRVALAID